MKLKIDQVSKAFRAQIALKKVSLEIPACKVLALLGPSGSGKSTFLRLIGGLSIPDSGTIFLDDKQIPSKESLLLGYRRSIGTVFQAFNLFPHLTALQNIELPLHRVQKMPLPEATTLALQLLKRFHLADHAFKKSSQLSGGQRQRVAIVRAVATKAKLLLLDEPTSALDPLMTSEVLDLIMELKESGRDIVLASHHISFVKKLADWIVFLDEGEVLESEATEVFFAEPKNEKVKLFLEKVLKY